jgi:tRNA (cmo5U34)-methyltransferase
MTAKSTPEEIRERFDRDVERFACLETGQSATIDAPLVLDPLTEAALATTPQARTVLDVGCGAGNHSITLARRKPGLDFTLLDLSRPMLDKALERLSREPVGRLVAIQGDVRDVEFENGRFDRILAGMVPRHLRHDDPWRIVFQRFHRALRPGGSLWVSDLIAYETPSLQAMMWRRYGDYLVSQRGEAYRDRVFASIDREDSPRSLSHQFDLLREVGFLRVEPLHHHLCFAAFGAIRGPSVPQP